VSRFIEAYFAKFDQLQQPPFQPKWREINLAGKVPGWTRYRVAEELLAKMAADQSGGSARFNAFLDSRAEATGNRALTSREREALFRQFLEWQRR
jgi:hypothetical protein